MRHEQRDSNETICLTHLLSRQDDPETDRFGIVSCAHKFLPIRSQLPNGRPEIIALAEGCFCLNWNASRKDERFPIKRRYCLRERRQQFVDSTCTPDRIVRGYCVVGNATGETGCFRGTSGCGPPAQAKQFVAL